MLKFKNKILVLSVIVLSIFGIIMIYSASSIWAQYKYNDQFKYIKAQILFFIIGLIIMYILSKIDYKIYEHKANKILLVCFILLILVLIPGIGKLRNGSRSWFGIGSLGIQPSEFAKIGLDIFVAKYLANNDSRVKKVWDGIMPILGIIFLFFGLIMLEPDFGQGIVIVLTLIVIIFVSGANLGFFTKCGLLGMLGMVGLIIMAPYRMQRIVAFLNPWSDPLGSGFQIIQSLYAIGPGGLLGLGFMNSIQKHFYLPEPQTDFIFAIISEEFGFLGVLFVSALFIIIFYRIIKIALSTSNLFGKYLAFGLGFGIIIQAGLNLAVVVGLIPVTGVTLPFLSYGGSSLIVSMISIGIILNIGKNNN